MIRDPEIRGKIVDTMIAAALIDENRYSFSLNDCAKDYLGEIKKWSLTQFYLDICKDKKILAFEHNDDFWFDCGSIEMLKKAELKLKSLS